MSNNVTKKIFITTKKPIRDSSLILETTAPNFIGNRPGFAYV